MGEQSEVTNARIKSTHLGPEDHGIFTAWLHLDYGGSGQGFGGYSLDTWSEKDKRRIGTAFGCEFIQRVLAVLNVESWEKLPGTYLRARIEGGMVRAIGHPLKDEWFDPKALADFMRAAKESR